MDFEFIKEFTPMFVKAGIFTVKLSVYGILLSLVIGIFCTLVKFYKVKILMPIVNGYIEVSRNTPLLIQLFFLYYGLSKFGLNLSAFTCAVAGLAFLGGSYMAESFRLGFEAVKKTQIEAALSVALTQGQLYLSHQRNLGHQHHCPARPSLRDQGYHRALLHDRRGAFYARS